MVTGGIPEDTETTHLHIVEDLVVVGQLVEVLMHLDLVLGLPGVKVLVEIIQMYNQGKVTGTAQIHYVATLTLLDERTATTAEGLVMHR